MLPPLSGTSVSAPEDDRSYTVIELAADIWRLAKQRPEEPRPGTRVNAHTNQLQGVTIGQHFAQSIHTGTRDLKIQALELIYLLKGEILDTQTRMFSPTRIEHHGVKNGK